MKSQRFYRITTKAHRRSAHKKTGDPILGWAGSWEHRARIKTLIAKHGGNCAICGKQVELREGPNEATIDHIVPISKGGQDLLSNLQLAHRACNEQKGNKKG